MVEPLEATNGWIADISAEIISRVGRSPLELKVSVDNGSCPDFLHLSSDDYLVIGTDVTDAYRHRLPSDVGCGSHERIVMIPNATIMSAAAELSRSADASR